MYRRDMLRAFGLGAAGLAAAGGLGGSVLAEDAPDAAAHAGHGGKADACARACAECALECCRGVQRSATGSAARR